MKHLEMRSAGLLESNCWLFHRHASGFLNHGILLGVLMTASCVSNVDGGGDQMRHNAALWRKQFASIAVGALVSADLIPVVGSKVRRLFWDEAVSPGVLIRQIEIVTHDCIDVSPLKINRQEFCANKIDDLSRSQRKLLRSIWEKRVIEALSTHYFESDVPELNRALQNGGITIYYLLVGRQNTAEMGNKDNVRMLFVNSEGKVIAKIKERYGASYPYGFIESRTWSYDYLF